MTDQVPSLSATHETNIARQSTRAKTKRTFNHNISQYDALSLLIYHPFPFMSARVLASGLVESPLLEWTVLPSYILNRMLRTNWKQLRKLLRRPCQRLILGDMNQSSLLLTVFSPQSARHWMIPGQDLPSSRILVQHTGAVYLP